VDADIVEKQFNKRELSQIFQLYYLQTHTLTRSGVYPLAKQQPCFNEQLNYEKVLPKIKLDYTRKTNIS